MDASCSILEGLGIDVSVGFFRFSFELPQKARRAIPPAIDFGTPEVDLGSTLYGLGADVGIFKNYKIFSEL